MFLLSYNTDTSAGAVTLHFIVCLPARVLISPLPLLGGTHLFVSLDSYLPVLHLQPKSLCLGDSRLFLLYKICMLQEDRMSSCEPHNL